MLYRFIGSKIIELYNNNAKSQYFFVPALYALYALYVLSMQVLTRA